ncbi:hypothetical protein ACIPJ1_11015 [Microbacterium maritypicum]|uniref:hypothetical protein n=1 Tax=Microbacterium maritypicum TaxID=33918 RepID=UPI003808D5C2
MFDGIPGTDMAEEAKPNPWARIIGPCYTLASMARALGWTEAEVVDRGLALQLLMLRSDEGVLLFPAFQLDDGVVVEGLTEVLTTLSGGVVDPWTWAQWLNAEPGDADSPRSIQQLWEGRLDEVLRDARQDASSWSA